MHIKFLEKAGLILLMCLAFSFLGTNMVNAMGKTHSLYDNPRVLIIMGNSNQQQKQIAMFEQSIVAMNDRDILVLVSQNSELKIMPELTHENFLNYDLSQFELYREASSNSDFTLHLIGKDEGLKEKWGEPVPFQIIADIIDKMPMRIRENNK